jgi:hypothetical protein
MSFRRQRYKGAASPKYSLERCLSLLLRFRARETEGMDSSVCSGLCVTRRRARATRSEHARRDSASGPVTRIRGDPQTRNSKICACGAVPLFCRGVAVPDGSPMGRADIWQGCGSFWHWRLSSVCQGSQSSGSLHQRL